MFGTLEAAQTRSLKCLAREGLLEVSVATFLDPVCFLLIKPDAGPPALRSVAFRSCEVCYNFMYRQPQTATQLLMHYFVARELFIAPLGFSSSLPLGPASPLASQAQLVPELLLASEPAVARGMDPSFDPSISLVCWLQELDMPCMVMLSGEDSIARVLPFGACGL